jgi:hypothetical protein
VSLSLNVLDAWLGPSGGHEETSDYFAAGVLQPAGDAREIPAAPERWPALGGEYWSDELDATFRIDVHDGRLCLSAPEPRRTLTLRDADRRIFQAGDLTLAFGPDTGRRQATLLVSVGRVRGLQFVRKDAARRVS